MYILTMKLNKTIIEPNIVTIQNAYLHTQFHQGKNEKMIRLTLYKMVLLKRYLRPKNQITLLPFNDVIMKYY